MEEKHYILAYGSLKVGESWYNSLKENSRWFNHIRYIETKGLFGFQIFKVDDPEEEGTLHDWTAAKYTGDNKHIITADIMEVSSELYGYIRTVIDHSNFVPMLKIIKEEHTEYLCELYVYNGPVRLENLIEDGETKSNSKRSQVSPDTAYKD